MLTAEESQLDLRDPAALPAMKASCNSMRTSKIAPAVFIQIVANRCGYVLREGNVAGIIFDPLVFFFGYIDLNKFSHGPSRARLRRPTRAQMVPQC
jgi:hypothetical protein